MKSEFQRRLSGVVPEIKKETPKKEVIVRGKDRAVVIIREVLSDVEAVLTNGKGGIAEDVKTLYWDSISDPKLYYVYVCTLTWDFIKRPDLPGLQTQYKQIKVKIRGDGHIEITLGTALSKKRMWTTSFNLKRLLESEILAAAKKDSFGTWMDDNFQ